STGRTKAVGIWGIRLEEYVRVNEFGKDLFYNNRFGGTTLAPQAQPVWAFGPTGIPTLPPEMERHFQDSLKSLDPETRQKKERRYRREPGYTLPGPGIFRESDADPPAPGYEGDPHHGLITGRDLIGVRKPSGEYQRTPDYHRGDPVWLTVLPLSRKGRVTPDMPPRATFRYVDDSRTGIHDIDSRNVYVDFDEIQRLLSMEGGEKVDAEGNVIGRFGPRCRQIQIKLRERYAKPPELHRIKDLVSATWGGFIWLSDAEDRSLMSAVDTQTWEEMQRDFISAIEKEKFLVLIMFGVISIVAVFLILCIFYMIVQEKTRDIGIIKSVGASAEGVTAVFLVYGAAIGLVGCVLGSILGTTFVEHINEIQDWLARLNPNWRVWSPEHYSFDKIPDVVKWSDITWISLLAIAASIAGAAFPAVRAGKTWPVESLRYE
ncbi:MAG: FtsX-like permease family protein, partial [Planctomycetota bacterium]|nr:FtsX-like permease family protein [Planctomycetota bacterium]